jgi:hypothetical protein
MPRIRIPKNAGVFRIVRTGSGGFGVWNDKTGPNKVRIACRDRKHAIELCKRLNAKEHNGEIWM